MDTSESRGNAIIRGNIGGISRVVQADRERLTNFVDEQTSK